jgi:2-methylisocitrate lyase-like PEP mutase family enzyme
MVQKFKDFKSLHQSDALFVLPNVWNARSAILFQELKFPAIATSSMAVANSIGYEDGEEMPFNDYLFIIKRILASIQVPLSVDMEMGYGANDEQIVTNIQRLTDLGIVGINIEDSSVNKSIRALKDAKSFSNTIEKIKNKLTAKGINLFINVRCDTYILNVKNKQKETLDRLKLYETTGADGVFLPCICDENDILEAVNNTKLPLNVMCVPGLPDFKRLNELGVKRISMGPFMFNKLYSNITKLSNAISADNSFAAIC